MSADILYNLPEFFSWLWMWCGEQDGRIAFGLGVLTWIVLVRVFTSFHNPLSAVIASISVVIVLLIALAAWIGWSGALETGEIPFIHATDTPNVDTLREVRQ